MKATQRRHDIGQRLWLDNITRGLLTSGTLGSCRGDFSDDLLSAFRSNAYTLSHRRRKA